MVRSLSILVAVLLFLGGCGGSAPSSQTITQGAQTAVATVAPSPQTSDLLDAAILSAVRDENLPGAIVSVRSAGFTYEKAFGVSDTTTRAGMRTDMFMRIGSVTKTFTVTAVLQLVDAGKIGLDDPVSKYVSGVPSGDVITIRELAGMRSGLFSYTDDENFVQTLVANPLRNWSNHELLSIAFSHPNVFAPGTDFQYCNTNAVVLGEVVEAVTGQPLAAFLQQQIYQPLHMGDTALPSDSFLPDPHAHGYSEKFAPGQVDATAWDPTWAAGAGAMYSRLDDLNTWAVALGTGSLLQPSTQAQRLQMVPFKHGPPGSTYGLGIFDVSGWDGHAGNLPGYTSLVMYLPSLQMSLVVLVNSDTSRDPAFVPCLVVGHAVTSIVSPNNVIPESRDIE